MKPLFLSAAALTLLLSPISTAWAEPLELARLKPDAAQAGEPLQAFQAPALPLPLPTSVVIGEGNRVEIIDTESGPALLLAKAPGAGRAAFTFGWPADSFPPVGIFSLQTVLRSSLGAEQSGNFSISLHAGEERLATLQIGKAGALHIILPNHDQPHAAGTLREKDGEFRTLEWQIDYEQQEIRLFIDEAPAITPIPLNAAGELRTTPTSVAFASPITPESSRSLEFREIGITHAPAE